jgi:predicted nucleic acid-binding protein
LQVFDASSMIYAWDNYPLQQFPGLWEWVAGQINQHQLVISSVAMKEVAHKTPECAEWLRNCKIQLLDMNNAILQDALRIKNLLGIVGDNYGGGVGENDLFIVATARAYKAELVTDERWQNIRPKKLADYKIPAVCDMDAVAVRWIKFVDYIKRSEIVFR